VKVKDVMSENVTCCSPDARLPEVARAMIECDCGEIPVVDDKQSMRPVGVVTDRDIVIRAVAAEQDTRELKAAECMTSPCVTATPETSLDDCMELMEKHQIRRVPVVDESGSCCGIVAQADIARHASRGETGRVVNEVSKPGTPSAASL
jgi:CBS domain-containing protein